MAIMVKPWARAVGLVFGCMLAASAVAQEQGPSKPFPPEQVDAIEEIIRAYLLEHPEVIVEAVRGLEARDRVAAEERQREAVAANRDALVDDPDSPVLGNPAGDVTIVEFFDYNCPYCRSVAKKLRRTVKEDGNLRLVMKEFPILGPQSLSAARAALAAARQDKYGDFHFALMSHAGELNDQAVFSVAREVGLDVERLKQDMQDVEIQGMLRKNYELAETLDVTGTPAFVIGGALVPGAVDMDALKRLVAEVRSQSG